MIRKPLPLDELRTTPFAIFDRRWFLLAAGDPAAGEANAMTVSWGALGTWWNRPVAQVLVRPTRHTFGLIERRGVFALCSFPERWRDELRRLGSVSGRDGDKLAGSGLGLAAARTVAAPVFDAADLVLECRVLHAQDLDPGRLLEPAVRELYPLDDWHRVYTAEVLALEAAPGWAD